MICFLPPFLFLSQLLSCHPVVRARAPLVSNRTRTTADHEPTKRLGKKRVFAQEDVAGLSTNTTTMAIKTSGDSLLRRRLTD